MCKIKCLCNVRESVMLAPGVFSLWLDAPKIAEQAAAGQFVSIYCKDGDKLLPRPISICEIDHDNGTMRFVYRVVGKGTEEFSKLCDGDSIEVLGPLGNGFPDEGSTPILIGGGIGIPPMLELAKKFAPNVTIVLGYRDDNLFLLDEFKKYGKVVIATDDGSVGTKGTVVDALCAENVQGDVIYSCGPMPMLRGIKAFGLEKEIAVYVSMEERMACGVGACLGCVCKSVDVDNHSKVKNKRVCKDGPVFLSTEVEI